MIERHPRYLALCMFLAAEWLGGQSGRLVSPWSLFRNRLSILANSRWTYLLRIFYFTFLIIPYLNGRTVHYANINP